MAGSTLGHLFCVTNFGESHGPAIGWVGRLEEDGAARHVLLCDPDETLAQPLLASVLLDPSEALAGFWRRANFSAMTVRDLIVQ